MRYEYKSSLVRVTDGDTIQLDCELGFYTRTRQKIRLANINCPEMNTDEGQAAKRYVEAWFTKHDNVCVLQSLKDGTKADSFGRFLGVIRSQKDDTDCLNVALVNAGLAVPYLVEKV